MLPLSMLFSGLFLLYLSSRPTYSPHNAYKFFAEATPVEATEIENDNIGYECGNTFFTVKEVNEVVSRCIVKMRSKKYSPQEYFGPLINNRDSKKYFLWPVAKNRKVLRFKYYNGSFYVLFTEDGEFIDVLARASNSQFTKCLKRNSSQMELSSTSDVTNGYQCSHEFISDELLQDALKIALEATGKRSIYPAPYRGNLFPENDEYKIWPIMKNGELYRSGSANIGIYYIIYDKQGELKEAVVRGFNNNFIRCMRTRKAPTAPASDPLNKLFVPASKQGYMCGRAFFEDKHLQEVAEIARGFSSNDKLRTKFKKMRFPIERNGEPFNRPYLLFPIVRFGKFYGKGNSGWYRVALELNYKVICAAMIIDGNVKPCEKTTIKGKIQHDTSDYLCGKRVFANEVLLRSTEEACVKMNGYFNNFYPASYSGPSYGPEGPYYTYPIIENHQDRLRAGQHRVVINASCEFLGALTKYNYGSETRLVKCHRLEDNPNMKFMPVDLNESISEHPILLG